MSCEGDFLPNLKKTLISNKRRAWNSFVKASDLYADAVQSGIGVKVAKAKSRNASRKLSMALKKLKEIEAKKAAIKFRRSNVDFARLSK